MKVVESERREKGREIYKLGLDPGKPTCREFEIRPMTNGKPFGG